MRPFQIPSGSVVTEAELQQWEPQWANGQYLAAHLTVRWRAPDGRRGSSGWHARRRNGFHRYHAEEDPATFAYPAEFIRLADQLGLRLDRRRKTVRTYDIPWQDWSDS